MATAESATEVASTESADQKHPTLPLVVMADVLGVAMNELGAPRGMDVAEPARAAMGSHQIARADVGII